MRLDLSAFSPAGGQSPDDLAADRLMGLLRESHAVDLDMLSQAHESFERVARPTCDDIFILASTTLTFAGILETTFSIAEKQALKFSAACRSNVRRRCDCVLGQFADAAYEALSQLSKGPGAADMPVNAKETALHLLRSKLSTAPACAQAALARFEGDLLSSSAGTGKTAAKPKL